MLAPDQARWFRFTTLGDGRGGNIIRLSPDDADVAFDIPAADQATLVSGTVRRDLSRVIDGETRSVIEAGGAGDSATVLKRCVGP